MIKFVLCLITGESPGKACKRLSFFQMLFKYNITMSRVGGEGVVEGIDVNKYVLINLVSAN